MTVARRRAFVGGLVVASALVAGPGAAAPGDPALGLELGAGTMLSADQRDQLGYSTALQGSLRLGLSLHEAWMFQLALGNWWFPSSRGYGRDIAFGLGLRFEPALGRDGRLGRLVVDAHPAITRSGGLQRFGFDFGVGWELALRPGVGLGPTVRYGQVRATDEDGTDDAKFWSVGLAVTLRPTVLAASR